MTLLYYKGYAIENKNGQYRLVLSPYQWYPSEAAIKKAIRHLNKLYDKNRFSKEVQG